MPYWPPDLVGYAWVAILLIANWMLVNIQVVLGYTSIQWLKLQMAHTLYSWSIDIFWVLTIRRKIEKRHRQLTRPFRCDCCEIPPKLAWNLQSPESPQSQSNQLGPIAWRHPNKWVQEIETLSFVNFHLQRAGMFKLFSIASNFRRFTSPVF